MTAEQFRNLMLRQLHLIVLCALCTGLGAFLGSLLTTSLYESTATLEVQIGLANQNVVVAQLAGTYTNSGAQLATSTAVLALVASHYADLSVSELRSETSASAVSNAQLIQIHVLDPSPTRAAALANDIATALITQQQSSLQAQRDEAQRPVIAHITSYQQLINTLTATLQSLPSTPQNASQIADLRMQLAAAQNSYTQWEQELVRITEAEAINDVAFQVADPAQPNKSPVRPSVAANVTAGILSGLLLGVLLVVLSAQVDQRVGSAEAVFEVLEWPVLAEIGAIPSAASGSENGVHPAESQADRDPYYRLTMALEFLRLDKPVRSVVIASATAADSADAVAADWALFLASMGKRVLLVDANLRHPSQAARFGLAADTGLSNAILAFSQPDQAAQTILRFIQPAGGMALPTLMVMPAGTVAPNPTELLTSQAMGHLFKAMLASDLDVLLFDAPSVVRPIDARVLAANTDGVLLVVDRQQARRARLERVRALLTAGGAHVLGCVVADASQTQPMETPRARRRESTSSTSPTVRVERATTAGPLMAVSLPDMPTSPLAFPSDSAPGSGEMSERAPQREAMS
jgi:non-specific protein-tyrosine kinase